MTVRSAWLLESGQTREDTRLAPLGAMTPADALTSRSGVLPGGTPFAASGASAMQLRITPGRAIVQGTALQGAYPVALSEAETLTFADGDPQFGRIDLVVLRVKDKVYDASAVSGAALEIIKGTPTATPAAPAVPATALPLWRVRVPTKASAGTGGITWASALDDLRTYTVAVGGILPASDLADGGHVGQVRVFAGRLQQWTGTAWQEFDLPGTIAPSTWGAWSEVTPAWRSTEGTPSIGNGKLKLRYARIGRTVFGNLRLAIGSGTNPGTGAAGWFWKLPIPPYPAPETADFAAGSASAFRSGVAAYTGVAQIAQATGEVYVQKDNHGFIWGNLGDVPFPNGPRAGDFLSVSFRYEAAS
ncbi:hypothetical protein ACIBSV_14810 [Embleya sp. NPDC050154]|uniref:hypothetical protein n=1 Tax=Embleya sp. NPDC050154 TaxID=3363988 RepID=UPI00378889F9